MRYIELEKINNVSVIRICRPEKLNALNKDLWLSLREVLSRECSEDSIGIVLTGCERAFSSGDDIREMYELRTLEESQRFFELLGSVAKILMLCEKPVVAAVNGLAVGGGAEILMIADYVIATRDAWFSFPEASLGLIPPLLLSVGTDLFNTKLCKKLALSSQRISVDEATRLGLVDEVVDNKDQLINRAIEVARTIYSSTSREVVSLVKKMIYARYIDFLDQNLKELSKLVLSEFAKKKMRDFLEKRHKK